MSQKLKFSKPAAPLSPGKLQAASWNQLVACLSPTAPSGLEETIASAHTVSNSPICRQSPAAVCHRLALLLPTCASVFAGACTYLPTHYIKVIQNTGTSCRDGDVVLTNWLGFQSLKFTIALLLAVLFLLIILKRNHARTHKIRNLHPVRIRMGWAAQPAQRLQAQPAS